MNCRGNASGDFREVGSGQIAQGLGGGVWISDRVPSTERSHWRL